MGIILKFLIGGAPMAQLKKNLFVCRVALVGILLVCGVQAGISQAPAAQSAGVKVKDFAGT
jgi:hypothetical protein